ncbi:hypothetical protein BKA80DRAFT_4886 [Phyllosticta citrichinensis]
MTMTSQMANFPHQHHAGNHRPPLLFHQDHCHRMTNRLCCAAMVAPPGNHIFQSPRFNTPICFASQSILFPVIHSSRPSETHTNPTCPNPTPHKEAARPASPLISGLAGHDPRNQHFLLLLLLLCHHLNCIVPPFWPLCTWRRTAALLRTQQARTYRCRVSVSPSPSPSFSLSLSSTMSMSTSVTSLTPAAR